MKHLLGIYEKALFNKPLPERMKEAAMAGYDCFEISIDETDERLSRLDWGNREFELCRKAAEENGLRLFSVCLSGHRRFPLGSADKQTQNKAMRILERGIRFCAELGVRVLQIAGYDVYYEPGTDATRARYLENLKKGAVMAESEGVMLSIEPVEKHITSVKQAMQIVREIDSPWLSIYPDVANLYMMGFDPIDELNCAKHHITAVHMREAPDDGYIPFGQGKLDFARILAALNAIDFSGPLVVELWNESNSRYMEIIMQAREFISRLITQIPQKGVK